MNFDIYTTKSKEAIQSAQQLMTQNHNPQRSCRSSPVSAAA